MKTWLLHNGLAYRVLNKLVALSLLLTCSFFAISAELRPFDAQYLAYRSGNDIGTASMQLQKTPIDPEVENNNLSTQYTLTYESRVRRFFISDKRFEKSQFVELNMQLIPQMYEYERSGTGPDSELKVKFNSLSNKITIDDNEPMEWQGELDNQLFRIDLPNKLAQGTTKTHYEFINYRGEKRRYDLEVVATENLNLPYGQLLAIKVVINRESSSRVTYAWFAPSLNHNLVRLQQFKNGKEQGDMQLQNFAYLK